MRPALASSTERGLPSSVVALQEERDFCLRSLLDLEAELAAGDLDRADYDALRESYVARAATALRRLDGGDTEGGMAPAFAGEVGADSPGQEVSTSPGGLAAGGDSGADTTSAAALAEPAARDAVADPAASAAADAPVALEANDGVPTTAMTPPRWRKRLLIGVGVVVAAGGAAWAVAASSGTRLPGQEITGQAVGSQAEVQYLQQAQQAADRGDGVTAVQDYQKVLKSDPTQPEALTGEGWLLAQTQQPTLLQQGLTMLASAEQAAPTYAPAHLYRGISLLSQGDYVGAISELQWYLAHNPDPQLAPRVRTALQQAQTRVSSAKSGR
jgi:hypothetical protein